MRTRFVKLPTAALVIAGGVSSEIGAQIAPSDFTYATRYDAAGQIVGTIAPDPDGTGPLRYPAVRNTFDARGRLIRVEKGQLKDWIEPSVLPSNWRDFAISNILEIEYDDWNRKTLERVRRTDGISTAVTQYNYNNRGLIECTAVRMNPREFQALPVSACNVGKEGEYGPDRIHRNLYDAAGQLIKIQKAYGTSLQQDYVTYTWNESGQKNSITDANGNKAEYAYDGYGRLQRWTFPSVSLSGQVNAEDFELYGYDDSGNRTSLRKRDGRLITYDYDLLNRVVAKRFNNGESRNVFYGYDLRGLQTFARFDSVTGGDVVMTTYSGFGDETSSTTSMEGRTRTIKSIYNEGGARTQITFPDGQTVKYDRDSLNRLNLVTLNDRTPLFRHKWNEAGLLSKVERYVSGGWGASTILGYDGSGRLNDIAHGIGGAPLSDSLSYNPDNQIVTRERNNSLYDFTGYVNISRDYETNGLNQYSKSGSAFFSYDANGNLANDGSTSYIYDVENRLTGTSLGVKLIYDPLGRLWQSSINGSAKTEYTYDGNRLVSENNEYGATVRRYVHGDGDDDPYVWFEGADTSSPLYLYKDQQGSILGISDNLGSSRAINSYDEYGIPGVGSSLSVNGRFRFTGQAWIPELGMYHYKARIYSPTLGRFLQTDPIGYDDQVNLYAYVANDPVNGRDPDGKQTVMGPVYDGLDRATAACGGDAQCGLREWNKVQQGVAVNVAITAATDGVAALAIGGLTVAARTLGLVDKAADVVKVGSAIERGSLSEAQASNLARFEGKLPANAGETTITAGNNGSVTMSATSPGRVPGSSATYTKTMDATGKTTGYTKTTTVPSGEVAHIKDKFNR